MITLTHRPTGTQAHAGERRSQSQNKSVALRRLRLALAVGLRAVPPAEPPPSGKTRVGFIASLDASITGPGVPSRACSALWRSRVGPGGRIVCNPEHHDYPALLAEALDAVAAVGWEPAPAAERLGVTPSQLIKLVKDHPPALHEWNLQRARLGSHMLK